MKNYSQTQSAKRCKTVRAVLLACSFGLLNVIPLYSANAEIPADNTLEFKVFRDGKDLGTHVLTFTPQKDGKLKVTVNVDLKYKIGPLTLFRYEHENNEIWDGKKPVSLNSWTYDDGDDYEVSAEWQNDKVIVKTLKETFETSKPLYTTSYWTADVLGNAPLLNTQKGQIEEMTVTKLDNKMIKTSSGEREAYGFDVQSKVPIQIWYDVKTDQWIGLEFEARGAPMTYMRTDSIDNSDFAESLGQ